MRSCNNYSLFKVRIYVFLIIVYARSFSHRTRASRRDWRMVYVASLSFIVCEHRGACNQRKEGFVILLISSGTPAPLLCQDKIRSWRSKPTCIYIQKIVRIP